MECLELGLRKRPKLGFRLPSTKPAARSTSTATWISKHLSTNGRKKMKYHYYSRIHSKYCDHKYFSAVKPATAADNMLACGFHGLSTRLVGSRPLHRSTQSGDACLATVQRHGRARIAWVHASWSRQILLMLPVIYRLGGSASDYH